MKVTPQMAQAGEAELSQLVMAVISDRTRSDLVTKVYEAMEVVRLSAFHETRKAGFAKARAEGRLKGRRSIIDMVRFKALVAEHGPQKAAQEMGIGKGTVYRLIRAEKKTANATSGSVSV